MYVCMGEPRTGSWGCCWASSAPARTRRQEPSWQLATWRRGSSMRCPGRGSRSCRTGRSRWRWTPCICMCVYVCVRVFAYVYVKVRMYICICICLCSLFVSLSFLSLLSLSPIGFLSRFSFFRLGHGRAQHYPGRTTKNSPHHQPPRPGPSTK